MGSGDTLPVGPGLWGFIAAFVLALALWLLMRNMNSRMRRMAYRERDRLEHEQEHGDEDAGVEGGRSDAEDGPGHRPGAVHGDREADSR